MINNAGAANTKGIAANLDSGVALALDVIAGLLLLDTVCAAAANAAPQHCDRP